MSNPSTRIKGQIERLERDNVFRDNRIYFIGLGAVAKLIAHSFSEIPEPPPMTLLFHRKAAPSEFYAQGSTLELIRDGISDHHRGFDAEFAPPANVVDTQSAANGGPIYNLVVGTKAPHTVSALLSIKHRLQPESTIVLLQNGMGLVEELNEKVFPDVESRPHYIIGIVSHGALNTSTFAVNHTGIGNIALTALAKIPFDGAQSMESPVTLLAPSSRYLLRTLTRTPLLGGIAMSPADLMLVQLEKLANNCVINPLTAVLECHNGELIHGMPMKLARLLLAEVSLVIRTMPELEAIPGIENRFGPAALERNVRKLMTTTAKNKSSMLQDITKGRLTEIDYLNGYIFRRGEELGIRCMVNYTVMAMVNAKSIMARDGKQKILPLSDHEVDMSMEV